MAKTHPTEARTRRGNRIYRNGYTHQDERKFASEYSLAIKKDGERHRLNLGADLEKAKRKADQICSFMAVPSNCFRDLFEHPDFQDIKKPRSYRPQLADAATSSLPLPEPKIPTVREILERYESKAVHLSPTTVVNNCNALRHLGARLLGLLPIRPTATKAKRKAWRDQVGRVRIDSFTMTALKEIRNRAIAKAGPDCVARGKANTTLNSTFRCARSIFSEDMLDFYTDFILPDPLPFKLIKPLREPSRHYKSRIDLPGVIRAAKKRFWDGVLNVTEEAERMSYLRRPRKVTPARLKTEDELIRDDKGRFIILLLTVSCGLRPKETAHLTWDQIDFEKREIEVAVTSYDTPKAKNSESTIDVTETVLGYLREFRPYSVIPPFVIPMVRGQSRGTRSPGRNLFRGLFKWLRENGVNCDNPLYIFRKEAGSIIYRKSKSYDFAADFLRNDPRIAKKHYVERQERLEVEVPGL